MSGTLPAIRAINITFGKIMKKELVILLVLLSLFFATGCIGNKAGTPNNTAIQATTMPEVITVSAAASLTEAFKDIASKFEKENPGTNVNFNFGSSGNLRMQVEGRASVDVFASADEHQMNILANKSLIMNSSRKDFARNSLVLIIHENSTLNIASINDLFSPKIQKNKHWKP